MLLYDRASFKKNKKILAFLLGWTDWTDWTVAYWSAEMMAGRNQGDPDFSSFSDPDSFNLNLVIPEEPPNPFQ